MSTRVDVLARRCARLVADPDEARERGRGGARARRSSATGCERFLADWDDVLAGGERR